MRLLYSNVNWFSIKAFIIFTEEVNLIKQGLFFVSKILTVRYIFGVI